jgi:hypothetical protein
MVRGHLAPWRLYNRRSYPAHSLLVRLAGSASYVLGWQRRIRQQAGAPRQVDSGRQSGEGVASCAGRPGGAFVDRKNANPFLAFTEPDKDAAISISGDESTIPTVETWLPSYPEYEFEGANIRQRYMVEVWCEKSTINEVLLPLRDQYGINVVVFAGDASITRCHEVVDRVRRDGRPCRILYVSDFDPKGKNMPTAVARKIEFRLRDEDLDLDIQLQPIALTHEQCVQYHLPRIPTKEGDRCAKGFEARFGEGATELDAMEALHPGELGEIISREIERFYDDDLSSEIEELEDEIKEDVTERTNEIHARYAEELSDIKREYREAAQEFNEKIRPIQEKYKSVRDRMTDDLENDRPDLNDYEWPEPADADEYEDPLFDSSRDYLTQIAKYREHKGQDDDFDGYVDTSTSAREARDAKLMAVVGEIQQSGVASFMGIANALNKRGITSPKGGKWSATTIKRVLARAA